MAFASPIHFRPAANRERCPAVTHRRQYRYRYVCAAAPLAASPAVLCTPVASPPHWECLEGCGACCNIGGYDADVLDELLVDAEDVALYNTMVGSGGWCVHLDQTSKACKIFNDRPWFCRIQKMATRNFKVAPEDVPQFANDCCEYHIDLVYGPDSPVSKKYNETIAVNFAHLIDTTCSEAEEEYQEPEDPNREAEQKTETREWVDDDDDDEEIVWTDEEFDCEEEACEIPGFDLDEEKLAPIPKGSSSH